MKNLRVLKLTTIWLVFIILMITPTFAVEMEEVAHQAEKYNEESKQKHGFFGKIKLIAKGFKLVDKAKKAEKESKKKTSETNDEVKETDNDVFKKHDQKVLDQMELLKYRESKNVVNNTVVNQNTNNSTNSSNSTVSTPIMPILPQSCTKHIEDVIKFLSEQGIEASYLKDTLIDSVLVGKIAQIIDTTGHIRYAEIISINDDTVTINTGTGNKEYTLDEFKKSFTGITITTNNPNQTLEKINIKEKNELELEKNKTHSIHDHAKNQVILWGILMGISVVLIIVGVLLAVTLGYSIIQALKNMPKYLAELKNPADGVEWIINGPTGVRFFKGITGKVDDVVALCNNLDVTIIVLGNLDMVMNVLTQNWVKVILCVVGLILALTGIGLMIAGIVKTVKNGIKWHTANLVTRENKKDNEELDKWFLTNNTISTNSTIPNNNITI